MSLYHKDDLTRLPKHKDFFVGLDSDGCVFPSMEVKQKRCFHTEIIRFWGLQKVEKELRECAEFINLYSKWRGTNRFPGLLLTFELLEKRPEFRAAGLPAIDYRALKAYCESGLPMSNGTLAREIERTGDPELKRIMAWSLAVNENVERTVKNIPPFRWVAESLDLIKAHADLIVVSQTPEEALIREWKEHRIDHYPAIIAGQELGTKAEHLALATQGRYEPRRVLMIGDAPGDLRAARANGACFFPVNPGHEEASWEAFVKEGFARFLAGTFAGDYEAGLVRTFESLLPGTPPWAA
jgi:phosphoglycolate phosphatase-like HAD superfamily hydrolase